MTKDALNLASTFEAARYYLNLGLKLVPVPRVHNHKDPNKRGWQTKTYDLKDFVTEQNIGARLGEEVAKGAFLADVDIDMKLADGVTAFPGAAEVVAELLPSAGWVFGRSAAPRAHLVYLTTASVQSEKYYGLNDKALIELRGLSKKKQSSQITIIPPGLHESQQRLEFAVFDPVQFASVKDASGLAEGVKHAAVALAVLQVWPELGKRHDARLAFSKLLHECDLPDQACIAILQAVMRATGSNVADVAQCFHDTLAKDPKDTFGASWIVDHLEDGAATLKVIDKILGRKAQAPAGSFDVTNIDLKTLTPAVWMRIRDTNDPVRQCLQGGIPVRVVRLPEQQEKRRPTWVFQVMEATRLRNEVAQVAAFFALQGPSFRQVVPPSDLIKDMLATEPTRVPLPSVTRITYAPTMAADGTIQLSPGYQAATGTFYVPDPGLSIPPVADSPSDSELARAVATLIEPITEFNFVEPADLTHAVGLLMLPFVRTLIDGPTPLHLFKKPIAGAGATLLTETLLYPSVGSDIAKMSTVNDDDEWRKTITATLLDGPSVTVIDNARALTSPVLAKVLTDSVWQARILGVSRNALLRVECAWVATGINPELHQEIMRRIVPSRLDPQVEQPWMRTNFRIPDLRQWSREHRGEMIWAALTLARAWHVAGRPAGERSLGMFENWASVIGGILKHAGFADFLANLPSVYVEADTEADAIYWFYNEWNNHHGDKPVRLPETALWALATGSPIVDLMNSSTDRGRSTAYGSFVRRLKDRVVEVNGVPLKIAPANTTHKQARSHTWRLSSVIPGATLPAQSATDVNIPF